MSNSNPEKAIQAIADPAPLTLAQIALFEKIDAPILHADISCLRDNLIAVWIYKTPLHEVARNFERREELALLMSENMTGEEYGNGLMKDEEIYTIFDTKKILNRPATVQISKTSGLAGIAYWINQTYGLEGDAQLDKRSDLVVALKEWVDNLYEEGRQTSMTDHELEEKIAELAPGQYQRR